LAAEDNIQVVNATTAAQYFHLLRRQVRRDKRKPLVVFTPKSLLRAKQARSSVESLVDGRFMEVVDDPGVGSPEDVQRVVLCTGKIAYDALAGRDKAGAPVAIVRVEQLYPWPEDQIASVLAKYERATEVVWLQEEPENMGSWYFVAGRLHKLVGEDYKIGHVTRIESGSPASGSAALHSLEQNDLIARVLA